MRWALIIPASMVAGLILVLVLYLAAVAASKQLLAETAPPEAVDAIVVLGGDGPARAEKAIELWHAGLAKRAIVAGDGDCTYIRDAMVAGGVPYDVIAIECLSRNTWMNATNTVPLLAALQIRSALLVTSWFHTGRALGVFRAVCPGIRWVPAETEPPPSLLLTAFGPYGPAIAKEYVKAGAYEIRKWLFPPGQPDPGRACVETGRGA